MFANLDEDRTRVFLLNVKRDRDTHGGEFCAEVPEDVWDGNNIQIRTLLPAIQHVLRWYGDHDVRLWYTLQRLTGNESLAFSFLFVLGRSATHSAILSAGTGRLNSAERTHGLFSKRDVLIAE